MQHRISALGTLALFIGSCCLGENHDVGWGPREGEYVVTDGALTDAVIVIDDPFDASATLTIEYVLPDGTLAHVTYEVVARELD